MYKNFRYDEEIEFTSDAVLAYDENHFPEQFVGLLFIEQMWDSTERIWDSLTERTESPSR